MQDFILQFIVSSVVSIGFTSFLVYLVKSYLSEKIKSQIKYEYDLKLDVHKNELLREANQELEELKASLKIAEIKSNIKLTWLHDKQAETIEVVHQYMWELFNALQDYTTIFQAMNQNEKDSKRLVVANKLDQIRKYKQLKLLYLTGDLSVKIDDALNEIQETALLFMSKVEQEVGREMLNKWQAIHNNVNSKIKLAIDDLVKEFRVILASN